MPSPAYRPTYTSSKALIVGIDQYKNASPLGYAVSDARAIAALLVASFGFLKEDVTVLVDEEATRENLLGQYLAFAGDSLDNDARLFFFFAGHGHTITGNRGEVGYLVPWDGHIGKLASLVRWDELTRNADLVRAKHILFVMDACYGGLAITRALPPGSMRFLKDMLVRPVRQVLTAGKANELVADSGGPIPGHSVFTGHLLQALEGNARSDDGVITANGVMAYVYERVARDEHSQQTPHYGFLSGDGDFVFAAPVLKESGEADVIDKDTLIVVTGSSEAATTTQSASDLDLTKEYLSDPKYKIKLDDLLSRTTRELGLAIAAPHFSTQAPAAVAEVAERLSKYEDVSKTLRGMISMIAYWGGAEHRPTLRKPLARLHDQLTVQGGTVAWIGLRWYPLDLLLTAGSIAALAAAKYDSLATIMLSEVTSHEYRNRSDPLVVTVEDGLSDARRTDVFKRIPGHERNYAPKSEHQFKILQAQLDDLLFLGRDYEALFDTAEIFKALVYAHHAQELGERFWGPVGRFAWKFTSHLGTDPFSKLLDQARRHGAAWPPLQAGFFRGDFHKFLAVAERYKDEILSELHWH